jgi:hypothetical protein
VIDLMKNDEDEEAQPDTPTIIITRQATAIHEERAILGLGSRGCLSRLLNQKQMIGDLGFRGGRVCVGSHNQASVESTLKCVDLVYSNTDWSCPDLSGPADRSPFHPGRSRLLLSQELVKVLMTVSWTKSQFCGGPVFGSEDGMRLQATDRVSRQSFVRSKRSSKITIEFDTIQY